MIATAERTLVAEPFAKRHVHVTAPFSLRTIFSAYRGRILFTYGLFTVENFLRLLHPLALGLAINDLLAASYRGVSLFILLNLIQVAIATVRQMYDTRAYTSIYTDLVTRLVAAARGRGDAVSQVAARSTLSRELVDFFERDVPLVFHAFYSVAGALIMLAFYDIWLAPMCMLLAVPAFAINSVYGRKVRQFNRRLNDEFEREVDVIQQNRPEAAQRHFHSLAQWRIKLSDCEAINVGVMELFVLGLMLAALMRSCLAPSASTGDIFAMFRYVVMFVMGFDRLPRLIQQFNRLHDISQRLRGV